MNTKNTKLLLEKYPQIFAQHKLSIMESCMPWLFECGNGWYWLLDNLCEEIQRYIDQNKKDQMEATQVKEKFGTLSFYTQGSDDYIQGIIGFAEHLSSKICEECGKDGELYQKNSWWRVRCQECKELVDARLRGLDV